MAKKSVVFTPLNTPPSGDQVNAPSKIEEPQYPDVGVAYAGYSKTPLSSNQFRLNPQTPWHLVLSGTALVGLTDYAIDGTPDLPADKDLYLTAIQLNTSIAAVDADTYVSIRYLVGVNSTEIWKTQLIRSESRGYLLGTPLKLPKNRTEIRVRLNASGTTINAFSICLQGWFE